MISFGERYICIKDNKEKGFIKGEIITLVIFSYEDSYSSSPFPNIQDEYQVPPFCPPETYTNWTIFDKNDISRSFKKNDVDEYFMLLKDKRDRVIKKILE